MNAVECGQGIRQVADVLSTGIAVLDRDGRLTLWNRWLERHSGIAATGTVGVRLADIFPEAVYPRLARAVAAALGKRMSGLISPALNPAPLPLYLTPDDRACDVRMDVLMHVIPLPESSPLGACLIQITDTTAAERREKRLQANARDLATEREHLTKLSGRLSAILENVCEAVLTIQEDGTVRAYNMAAQEVFGYGADEVLGQNVRMLMPSPDAERHDQYLQRYLRDGTSRIIGTGRRVHGKRKNGTVFPMQLGVTEVQGGFGREFVGVVSDLSDIEAARQRERDALAEIERHRNHLEDLVRARTAELEVAKDAAEASNRTKSAFLNNISHEMRTPLHQISGLARLVGREPLTDKQANRLDHLVRASQRLSEIIETVLELTRIEAGRHELLDEPLDMEALVRDTLTARRPDAELKGLQLSLETAVLPGMLRGDRKALKKALNVYLDNAIRFTSAGGIMVRLQVLSDEAKSMLLRLEVTDTGLGIAEADQGRLFNLFEQVDNALTRQFSGLGASLAMTRRLANAMGGDAGCSSKEGAGSTFWFTARLKKASETA